MEEDERRVWSSPAKLPAAGPFRDHRMAWLPCARAKAMGRALSSADSPGDERHGRDGPLERRQALAVVVGEVAEARPSHQRVRLLCGFSCGSARINC